MLFSGAGSWENSIFALNQLLILDPRTVSVISAASFEQLSVLFVWCLNEEPKNTTFLRVSLLSCELPDAFAGQAACPTKTLLWLQEKQT